MKQSTEDFLEEILTRKHDKIVELAKTIANCRKHEVTLSNDGLYNGETYGPFYYWSDYFELSCEYIDKYMLRCLVAVVVEQMTTLGYGEYIIEEEYPYDDDKRELNCIIRKRISLNNPNDNTNPKT